MSTALPAPNGPSRTGAWVMGTLGTFLIMAGLVWALIHFTRPEDLAAARALERQKFLQETRQAEAQSVEHYAWQDRTKEIVRLPIRRALEITVQEWQDPAAARSNLIARSVKASAVPPPPPPPANPYE